MVKIESIFQQVLLSLRWQHMGQSNHDDDMSAIFSFSLPLYQEVYNMFLVLSFQKN